MSIIHQNKLTRAKIEFEVGLVEPHLLRSCVAISRTMKRVSDLCHHISFSFGFKSGVYLPVEEFTLPPSENICDAIIPKRCNSSSFKLEIVCLCKR